MNLQSEARLAQYFDRQMTPAEEQNFLISLAASDELRLAFRGQLELMKAIRDDKRTMQPIAHVRSRTLAALGLTGAAVTPFLEQALLHNDANAAEVSTASVSFFSRFGAQLLIGAGGLATGFLASVLLFSHPTTNDAAIKAPATQSVTAPAIDRSPAQQNFEAPQHSDAVSQIQTAVPQTSSARTTHSRHAGSVQPVLHPRQAQPSESEHSITPGESSGNSVSTAHPVDNRGAAIKATVTPDTSK